MSVDVEFIKKIRAYRKLFGGGVKEVADIIKANPNIHIPDTTATVYVVINLGTGQFKTQKRHTRTKGWKWAYWSDKLENAYQYKTKAVAEEAMTNYNLGKSIPIRYDVLPLTISL